MQGWTRDQIAPFAYEARCSYHSLYKNKKWIQRVIISNPLELGPSSWKLKVNTKTLNKIFFFTFFNFSTSVEHEVNRITNQKSLRGFVCDFLSTFQTYLRIHWFHHYHIILELANNLLIHSNCTQYPKRDVSSGHIAPYLNKNE